ncbi:MAG: hypothetical protein AAFS10_13950 [Myxococcota bacterium]
MQRLTSQQRALLCWVALPMGLMFLIMLACVAPVEEECLGSNCAGLTPQQQQELAETQDLLLGTWDLTYEGYNRDDVDRLLFAGRSTWSLEIFDVTRATDGLYNWRGAIKPTELCLVSQADFDDKAPHVKRWAPSRQAPARVTPAPSGSSMPSVASTTPPKRCLMRVDSVRHASFLQTLRWGMPT